MYSLSFIDLAIIVIYFAAMIGIGYWSMRKIKSQEDFFMGGRGFGKMLQIFAVFGAGTSTDSPVGTARNTFVGGLSGIWTVLNYLFVTPFYWFTGLWYRRYRMLTMGDFFEERYQSKPMAGTYAIFGLFFFIAWLSVGFSAASKTIVALTPIPAHELTAAQSAEVADFQRMKQLEAMDYNILSADELTELETLREMKPKGSFSYINGPLLIVIMGAVTLIYSIAGGITAAYITDFIQGLFIILLSFILIPFGLHKISLLNGGSGMMDGFSIMHQKLPEYFFDILGSPFASDFTWYYLLGVTAINLVGIVVQPHMIVVGGGSAKDEISARVGNMVGNFIKRFLTIFWTLAGLIAIALYAGQIDDPDLVWGHMTLDLLGPLGLGMVGLMISALMAALMSSASCSTLVASSLLVKNLYSWFKPNRSESHYVFVGRMATGVTILGGVFFSIYYYDIFDQLKVAWELPVIFASTVWVGMFWRRASKKAAWITVLVTAILFFIIPMLSPVVYPQLRTEEKFLAVTQVEPITRVYNAREMDVTQRLEEIDSWNKRHATGLEVGVQPKPLELGQEIEKTSKPPSKSIYWTKGIRVDKDGTRIGQGFFNIELAFLDMIGLDMSKMANPMIETLRLPFKLILPILLMLILSPLTRPVRKDKLDRFFAKMKTPVQPDPEQDRQELEKSYADPSRYDHLKMFPNTELEFTKWDKTDTIGFLAGIGGTILVIALTLFVANIGS